MTEPVHFFDRQQIPGNFFAKSVTVQKINALGNENIVEHPKFFEQSDTFEVTCFMQVPDGLNPLRYRVAHDGHLANRAEALGAVMWLASS